MCPPFSHVSKQAAGSLPAQSATVLLDQHVDGETMKAVVWEGKPGQMSVRIVPKPRIQGSRNLLVRITTAAICGTDLHTYHGFFGGSNVPYVMGHEAVGVVEEVGSEVTEYQPGDRVIVLAAGTLSDGRLQGFGFGNLYASPDFGGLQAEYALAPDSGFVQRVPAGKEHELDYLTCADVFVTAWTAALDLSDFQAGESVLVYGAGAVGLETAYAALLRGAVKVYVVDHVAARLAKAKEIGAIPIDLTQGSPAEQVLKLEPQGVARVCDCVGDECVDTHLRPDRSFILNDAVRAVAAAGGIALTGLYYGAEPNAGQPLASLERDDLDFNSSGQWWLKTASLRGGVVLPQDTVGRLIDLIESGRANPGFVFDYCVGIEEAPEAYRLFDERMILKAAIRF